MSLTVASEPAPTRLADTPYGFTQIVKRDGRCVPFDAAKITAAIAAAGAATGELDEAIARRLTIRVLSLVQQVIRNREPSVEEIQDVVEEVLISSPYPHTAKAYIIYRDQHARLREIVSLSDVERVDEYLQRSDWKVRENSNMAYSLQGLNNYIASEISAAYWLNKIYPEEIRHAHLDGDLHLHDLNLLSVYCVGWDLYDLLLQGFRGAPGKCESAPARHLRTALGQVVNFFYTLQGEAAGAQAFSSFDTLLAPFVRADDLSYAEVRQAMQEFIFNLNVPTRVGFQTPFTNLTLDLEVPPHYAGLPAVVGGEPLSTTYGEYRRERRWITRALFEVLAEGDARGRVFTFPIPTINIGPDFDWQDPELEPLWQATARYGIPYFANFIGSDMAPEDARSMCCRLRLDLRGLERRGGGLFGANPLTGSIGVVTINLPRLGLLAADEDQLLARLDEVMDLARASLEIKRKALERFTEQGLYPYTAYYLRSIKQRFGSYWHNHFSTIGLVGGEEACRSLLGVGLADPAGQDLALRLLDHMRERLQGFQEETGHLYNLEATPAEGAAYRLARLDRQRFPHHANVLPQLYTNSTQLPVDATDDVFEALDLQDALQSRYTGGTVLHVFAGEAQADPGAVRSFVRRVFKSYRLPYLTFTPTFSICPEHGYRSGEHTYCPDCDAECEVYSRVVGYLRPVSQWNEGKAREFCARTPYRIGG